MESQACAAPPPARGSFPRRRLGRRALLKLAAGGSVVALQLLAACAPQPPASPTPAAKAPAQPTTAAAPQPAATAAPAAAPTAAPAAQPAGQQVLKLAWNAAPPSFNPLTAVSRAQNHFFWTAMSTLTQADPVKGEFAPDLAESWKIAPDGSSYTFTLRKNAKWHDGQPVTAKDVAYTYTMAANAATGSKLTGRMSLIKGAADYTAEKAEKVAGITVVDDHTITFDMEFPNGLFMYETASALPFAILPEHVLGSTKPEDLPKHRFFSEAPVGSGPFKFVKYAPDQFVEVEANPDYYFGRPKLDRIVFNIIKSPDTIEVAMERGEIDMPIFDGGTATTAMLQKFVKDPRFMLFGTPGTTIIGYFFNYRHDFLKDERVHQALLYALDRKKLVERFNAGNGTIVNSFLTHSWYQKPEWASLYPFDPDKARALLKEAGWDTNRTVPVNVITLANEDIRSMVAAEQQMLADVGFKISFREMELPVWVEKFYDSHDFEMARVTAGVFPDPDGFLNFHMKTTSKNAFGWANPEFDKRIEQGRRMVDQAERAKFYQALNEEMLKAVPVAPVYLENAWWMKAQKWHVPQLADVKPATSLTDVPIVKSFIGHSDIWKFHMEQWEIK
jgi:peptide/nickel transport system substrate-binding protein